MQRNIDSLNDVEKETLKGKKKGRFISLKSKIEKYQKVLRDDGIPKIITSDPNQIDDKFRTFFEEYEQLRNSSVHYSPLKERIWMKPKDWLDKANEFAKLSLTVSRQFWKACYEDFDDPQYLGKLDFDFHFDAAKDKLKMLTEIEGSVNQKDDR